MWLMMRRLTVFIGDCCLIETTLLVTMFSLFFLRKRLFMRPVMRILVVFVGGCCLISSYLFQAISLIRTEPSLQYVYCQVLTRSPTSAAACWAAVGAVHST